MAKVESRIQKRAAGATKPSEADVKGKIVEFAWWMKKQGYRESTIEGYADTIKELARKTNIFNPESVKEFIAKQSWKESTKGITVDRYTCFLRMLGLTWDPPKYKPRESLPFIPYEEEIDSLIASCGRKMATFLQGLKETGADPGELIAVRWIDVDSKNRTIAINHPVKGHNPRILPISRKLIDMIQRLPKRSERVFGNITRHDMYSNFHPQRKRAATKLANPRLKEITFITFRHWKGTIEYHKFRDPYHVKKILGHKRLSSTEIYINLEQAHFKITSEDFTVRVAESVEEDKELIEAGFEYVTDRGSLKIYRKRK